MKKIAMLMMVSIGMTALSFAAWFELEPIQISQTSTTNSHPTNPDGVSRKTVNKPAVGSRTCFTNITVSAVNHPGQYTFSILEGPLESLATAYMVDNTTGPVTTTWDSAYPLCLTPGTTGYFQVIATSTTWKINASGYIKK